MNHRWTSKFSLHLMVWPGIITVIIFSYIPLFGLIMAFEKYVPSKGIIGSKWVGLDNFRYVIHLPDFFQVVLNTIFIAVMKIIVGLLVPIAISLLLNEMRIAFIKRSIQTLVYLPHFLSWVILGGIIVDILSPSTGIVNQLLQAVGIDPIFFLGDNKWFPFTLVLSNEWKEFGFSTIVYLAAIAGINPSLYESAVIDGANRWKCALHITLPSIVPIIVLMATLSIGSILNAGFEQVFNLYSPVVYQSGDIIDTFVYRIGLIDAQYGVATAVGMMKSLVSLVLISLSYYLAYRIANYRIF